MQLFGGWSFNLLATKCVISTPQYQSNTTKESRVLLLLEEIIIIIIQEEEEEEEDYFKILVLLEN